MPKLARHKLENSPYKSEYIQMRMRGTPIKKVYEYYLEKEGYLEEERGETPVSYVTFMRWLQAQGLPKITSTSSMKELTKMALDIIERDREILEQLDENLQLLKPLSQSLSSLAEETDKLNPRIVRTLVEVVRETRQTIQTIIELRNKLKALGMVSPTLVRDALVEAIAALPLEQQKLVLKRFDDVISRIITMRVSRSQEEQ